MADTDESGRIRKSLLRKAAMHNMIGDNFTNEQK